MLNLLKADFYRLFKTKSYYVVGLVLGLFGVMMMYLFGNMMNNGMSPTDLGLASNTIQFSELLYNVFYNSLIVLIIGIEASIFICTDYSSGYIKNIASGVNRKLIISLSKFITMSIGVIIYFVVMALFTYISGIIFIDNMVLGNVTELAKYIGMVTFLAVVMVGLVVFFSSLFRSNSTTIIAFILVVLLASIAYMAIYEFLNIDLSSISPIMNYSEVAPGDTSSWGTMILSGLGFMGVYLVGSSILMEVKDII